MEEALGDCANVHMMYPGFVFGFLHFIRYASTRDIERADASFDGDGNPLPHLIRYHEVLVSLSGRATITDPAMRYESVGLVVYACQERKTQVYRHYPAPSSPVHYSRFFERLYQLYDLRFSYPFPQGQAARKTWTVTGLEASGEFDATLGFGWRTRR
jgi:hypothetical protein